MSAVDETFLSIVHANPHLRPRVGNPDEMRSNRMQKTLDALLFRVTRPEHGLPEGVLGAVVTALNEEAVCCAGLGNKGGISIVVTYEAFGTKMHGAVRQEVIWAQEEPRNQGAWYWLASRQHLVNVLGSKRKLLLVARPAAASPAVGYYAKHNAQQKTVIENAFGPLKD